MSAYIDAYREWKMLSARLKKDRRKLTPEKYQELKSKERELLIKLNSML